MFKLGKFLVTLVLAGSLLAPAAQALTTITSTGLDASGPEAAFINWQNFVTGEVTD